MLAFYFDSLFKCLVYFNLCGCFKSTASSVLILVVTYPENKQTIILVAESMY